MGIPALSHLYNMKPINVYLLALPGTMLLDLAGVGEPLRVAERLGAPFRLQVIGPESMPMSFFGLALQGVQALPASLPRDAIVIVPGLDITPKPFPQHEAGQAAAWLTEVSRPDTILCALGTGTFLAAACGLLDGRQCTTHHAYTERLRQGHPRVRVVENRLVVKDGNVYTSAGISAGVDLALHLIAEHGGPLIALEVAKSMVIYLRRAGADPQLSPWLIHRNHLHPRIHQAQDLIIRDPRANWSIAQLAERVHTSPRNLSRLFQVHAGIAPLSYLRKIRAATARELRANTPLNMEQLADMAGFSSAEQMRRAWRRFDDTSPEDLASGSDTPRSRPRAQS